MKLDLSSLPDGTLVKVKIIIYAIQTLLVFLVWILTITVLTKSGDTGSATKFYFTLTWLCIPAFLYLAVVPLWPRTQRFENIYAVAAVDVCFTIFWLSALCAVQVWTDSGVNTASGCANFTFGSQSKCQTSYASVIMGTFVFAFWLLASIISVFSLLHFRKHGSLPNKRPSISNPVFDDKSARSSINSNSNKDLEKEARSRPQTRLYRERFDVEHGSVHTETEDGTHPGRPVSIGGQELPKTAPATYTQFSVPPQWKQIFYGEVGLTNETEPAPRHLSPPLGSRRKPAPARLPTPPSINIYTTGNSYAQEIVSARRPAPFDTLRGMPRGPVPGPASQHIGGYHSAHHTPMPLGLGGKMQGSRYDQAMVSPEYKGRLKFPEADYGRI